MNSLKLFFSIAVCLLVLYDPSFRHINVGPYIISIFLILIYLACFGWQESWCFSILKRDFLAYFALLSFLAGLLVISVIKRGDATVATSWLLYLGVVIPVFVSIYWAVFVGARPYVFFESVALAAVVQSFFIMGESFLYFVPPFIDYFFERPALAVNSYRASGFSSMTGDGLSFIQFFGFFSATTLALLSQRLQSTLFWGFLSCIIFLSMFFIGRTGIFLCIFLVSTLLFVMRPSLSLVIFVVVACFSVFFVSFLDYRYLSVSSDVFFAIEHSLRPFIALLKGDLSLSPALNDLVSNHLVFPNSLDSWVFGLGQWLSPDGNNFQGTDIGYIRIIWYAGLLGLFLFAFCFSVVFRIIINASHEYKIYISLFLVCFLVANLKFPFLFWSQVVFFLGVVYLSVTRYKSRFS